MEKEPLLYEDRCLRTRSSKLLMGPAGNRLFVDYLDKCPGFRGRIDYLHKVNLTEVGVIICRELEKQMEYAKAVWSPEVLEMNYRDQELVFREEKYITRGDEAVSVQSWTNCGKRILTLEFSCEPALCRVENGRRSDDWIRKVTSPMTEHGYQFYFYVFCREFAEKSTYILQPGETKEFKLIAVFRMLGEQRETVQDLTERKDEISQEKKEKNRGMNPILTGKRLEKMSAEELKERQLKQCSFYQKIPSFYSSDPLLNKTWEYRWYILNNCYAEPEYGNYRHGVMYEGRSHKMGKAPFHPTGWEFTKMIPLSTALQLTDLRWNGEKHYGEEMILSLIDSADENGEFRVMACDGYGNSYSNYGIWAYWNYYKLHPDAGFLAKVLEDLKRYVDCLLNRYTDGKDLLQIVKIHQLTGKEYQPSFWYFHGYPKDCRKQDTYTFLKRVDSSVYFYLNLLGLSCLCGELGDGKENYYKQLAQQLQQEINEKMWDENTGFYYDLHYQTEEKAYVRNIVGFYPWWAELITHEDRNGLKVLQSKEFQTEYLFPSVARNCPAYSPAGGWMGDFIKGRDGCVWNGPSWPYTNGIIIDMLGKAARKNPEHTELFGNYLHRYALQHFRDGNLDRPYLVEHYNPETGEPLSDEPDYNHSFFIDLIMKYVVGIEVKPEEVVVKPLDLGLRSFACSNIGVRGHLLDIVYEDGQRFEVLLDGKTVKQGDQLEEITLKI